MIPVTSAAPYSFLSVTNKNARPEEKIQPPTSQENHYEKLSLAERPSVFGWAHRGFNCWTSVAPAFQSWFAVEYSSCFITLMNLDLYVRFFDSLMSRGPSRGPNNFYVYNKT